MIPQLLNLARTANRDIDGSWYSCDDIFLDRWCGTSRRHTLNASRTCTLFRAIGRFDTLALLSSWTPTEETLHRSKGFRWSYLIRTDKYNMRLILCSMLIIAYCVLAWWPVAPWPAPTGFASPSASNLRSCDCHQLRGIHLDTVLLRSNHYSTVVAGVLREYF